VAGQVSFVLKNGNIVDASNQPLLIPDRGQYDSIQAPTITRLIVGLKDNSRFLKRMPFSTLFAIVPFFNIIQMYCSSLAKAIRIVLLEPSYTVSLIFDPPI
jgi:hypothetical protein